MPYDDPMEEGDLTDELEHISSDIYLDVPFVPTDDAVIETMLDLANVGPDDILYDLGSGDGRIVVAAAMTRNTSGVGIELDPMRVAEAMEYAADSRVEFLVDFIEEDIFSADIREATVVTMYLLHSINIDLRPRLLKELRPGTRIVSHAFDMGDWTPDATLEVSGIGIYMWVVPAQVEGAWAWEDSNGNAFHIELEQKYQKITGQAWQADEEIDIKSATLDGCDLRLALQKGPGAPRHRFTLTFDGTDLAEVVENAA